MPEINNTKETQDTKDTKETKETKDTQKPAERKNPYDNKHHMLFGGYLNNDKLKKKNAEKNESCLNNK